jgi:hypothetical protein
VIYVKWKTLAVSHTPLSGLPSNPVPRTSIVRQFVEVRVGRARVRASTASVTVTKSNSFETRCNTVVADDVAVVN